MNVPDYCFALLNTSINPKTKEGRVIKIVAFETGYYPTSIEQTQEFVDNFNKIQLKVSKAEARAMETASMFGWDTYKNVLESYQKLEEEKQENENEE